ncbi:hypothetical protein HY523_02460 [Candidatus Berkelbacteria bacterium]|nr:hypothetical protein [Candidatus Berkelbacteria bacterium]
MKGDFLAMVMHLKTRTAEPQTTHRVSCTERLEAVRGWAQPVEPPPMQMRITLYRGSFPDKDGMNFFGILTGSQADFLAALPEKIERRYRFSHQQGTIDSFAEGLRKLGLDLIVDAVEVTTPQGIVRGLLAAIRHLPAAILGQIKLPAPRGHSDEIPYRGRIVAEMHELARRARNCGAQRIVLGALSKVHGLDQELAAANILDVATGQSLTGCVQAVHVREMARRLSGWPTETPRIGILGATGAVGRRVTTLLAPHFPLSIVSRHQRVLRAFAQAMRGIEPAAPGITIYPAEQMQECLASCQIVLILTTELTLTRAMLPANPDEWPYLIDAARPEAIPADLFDHERMDRGGYVWLPGNGIHLEDQRMRFPRRWLLPCLAEAIPLLAAGYRGHFGLEPAKINDKGDWEVRVPWGTPADLAAHLINLRQEMALIDRLAHEAGLEVVGL